MSIRVKMLPHLSHFQNWESGIKRVVEAYFKYLPQFDIELVEPDTTSYDLVATHAGEGGPVADVCHTHGLYWTADYQATKGEYQTNRNVVEAVRNSKEVTVPSSWVAETFQRDMRFTPHIIPHGIDWQEWQHKEENRGFVLFNKNAIGGWVDFDALKYLSQKFPRITFVSTFDVDENNVQVSGIIPHQEMKLAIQRCSVYLSIAKETFSIGNLEAMASGKPILGFANGGNPDLVEHGVNGYLARPGDYEDLAEGLIYCLKHQEALGDNAKEMVRGWTWEAACEKVAGVYRLALKEEKPTVGVVIPVFNKPIEQVKRAIDSCLAQTLKPEQVIVVDDGSGEDIQILLVELMSSYSTNLGIRLSLQSNQGVAHARNNGIAQLNTKYVSCLDSDDWIEPTFLETCVNTLENDRLLGLAYTSLRGWWPDSGNSQVGEWPGQWDYDKQCNYEARHNQVPTCNVFRRKVWERLGGYRQRYAPTGAGAEDAEFWTRIGAYGWKCQKVTEEPLFNYQFGGQVTGDLNYKEVDWLINHPWAKDKQHPFASYATPQGLSHPVRQYDEPTVSVVIPVGPGHEKNVIDVLDSLEAQTFRKWEAIVVWDSVYTDVNERYKFEARPEIKSLLEAYPYIKFLDTGFTKRGPGYARNRGVEIARAPFISFLDADDTYHPEFLSKCLKGWNQYQTAIYTDYVGQTFAGQEVADKLKKEKKLLHYNSHTGEILMRGGRFEFDCPRALRQPDKDLYIWNLVSTLYPKAWHDEIGGFDEKMETWEDVDYAWRMVFAGHCFTRIPEELVRYRFHTGLRRDQAAADTEEGRQKALSVIQYLKAKYQGLERKMCGCRKRNNGANPLKTAGLVQQESIMSDSQFVKARFMGGRGNRRVVGHFIHPQHPGVTCKKAPGGFRIDYGYISEGTELPVHVEDIRVMVGKWQPIQDEVVIGTPVQRVELPEPASIRPKIREPKPITKIPRQEGFVKKPKWEGEPSAVSKSGLQLLPGMTPLILSNLKQANITTPEQINSLTVDELGVLGMGGDKAKILLRYVANLPVFGGLDEAVATGHTEERIINHLKSKKASDLIRMVKAGDIEKEDIKQLLAWEEEKGKPRKTVVRALEKALKDD